MPLLLRAKCVLVGDSGVGKSAIAQSFHSDGTHFPKAYTMVSSCRPQIPERRGRPRARLASDALQGRMSDLFVCLTERFVSTVLHATQTKGVEICVKTVALPESKDAVVGGAAHLT